MSFLVFSSGFFSLVLASEIVEIAFPQGTFYFQILFSNTITFFVLEVIETVIIFYASFLNRCLFSAKENTLENTKIVKR